MVFSQASQITSVTDNIIAIAWCLAWGEKHQPQVELETLHQMRQALLAEQAVPSEVENFVDLAWQLQAPATDAFPETAAALKVQYPALWAEKTKVGLVYGGATKIKQYVFEAAKLQDIRGASALLDRVNLVDLPAFFGRDPIDQDNYRRLPAIDYWLDANQFGNLKNALIPELIVYSTGGNILAFCPTVFVDELANAIEKRYTHETLTANSCAVGAAFRLLETQFGLLQDPIEHTFWFDKLQTDWKSNSAIRAYFSLPEPKDEEGKPGKPDLETAFRNRKNFNELVGKLATQFNLRRSGFDQQAERPSRRYPPMLETHPYLRRDDSDRQSLVERVSADRLPDEPKLSDTLARKRIVGQVTKREDSRGQQWYFRRSSPFYQKNDGRSSLWKPGLINSWVTKFKGFLDQTPEQHRKYYKHFPESTERRERELVQEARSLKEISDASNGFVAYIYADGNNMGQHIRDKIKTPQDYRQFSEDIFEATE